MCVKSPASGLLSAIVIFVTGQTPLFKILESRIAAAGMSGNALPVCTTVCASVGKRLHTLPSYPTLGEPESFS